MALMTVGADRRAGIASGDGAGMNALLIGHERAFSDPASPHDRFVAVALSTCFGDVGAVDRGGWIAGREERRHVAVSGVTIETRCRFGSALNRPGVKTAII